jgi:hypothetical protein
MSVGVPAAVDVKGTLAGVRDDFLLLMGRDFASFAVSAEDVAFRPYSPGISFQVPKACGAVYIHALAPEKARLVRTPFLRVGKTMRTKRVKDEHFYVSGSSLSKHLDLLPSEIKAGLGIEPGWFRHARPYEFWMEKHVELHAFFLQCKWPGTLGLVRARRVLALLEAYTEARLEPIF